MGCARRVLCSPANHLYYISNYKKLKRFNLFVLMFFEILRFFKFTQKTLVFYYLISFEFYNSDSAFNDHDRCLNHQHPFRKRERKQEFHEKIHRKPLLSRAEQSSSKNKWIQRKIHPGRAAASSKTLHY